MPALYTIKYATYILFQQSICGVAIPGCYELTMRKKVQLEKVCTKKVCKTEKKVLSLAGLESTP